MASQARFFFFDKRLYIFRMKKKKFLNCHHQSSVVAVNKKQTLLEKLTVVEKKSVFKHCTLVKRKQHTNTIMLNTWSWRSTQYHRFVFSQPRVQEWLVTYCVNGRYDDVVCCHLVSLHLNLWNLRCPRDPLALYRHLQYNSIKGF